MDDREHSFRFRVARRGAWRPGTILLLFAVMIIAAVAVGCGDPSEQRTSPPASPSVTPTLSAVAEADLVRAAFDGALQALQDGNLQAWRAALPVGVPEGGASPSPDRSGGAESDDAGGASASPTAEPSGGVPSPSASAGAVDVAAVLGGRLLREDLDEIFAHLLPLRLRAPHAVVQAVPGRPHVYSVRFTGLIGRAGPPDRILAERILRVQVDRGAAGGMSAAVEPESTGDGNGGAGGNEDGSPGDEDAGASGDGDATASPTATETAAATASPPVAGAVRIVADDTPPEVMRQNVMAFNKPLVIVRDGLVLVYENAWRARATRLAPLADAARSHVESMYGVDAGRAAVVFLYASRDQVMLALAALPGQVDPRIKYFSHPAQRVADRLWSPTDVGVVAPALNGVEAWAPYMLQHEIAHAYTLGWFFDTAHAPDFLEEGLAVAAEETHNWTRLQAALAGDGLHPALADAIALGDIWSGRETEDVRVLYSAGGSLVDFILQHWGRDDLRLWVRQVADSDLSRQAIADITKRRFGTSWPAFVADWRAYVEQL